MAHAPETTTITIQLFGTMQVWRGPQPITDFASRKAEALLAYLLLTPAAQPRERLADLLWDDRTQKQALGNLRVLLSNLRKLFPDLLLINRQSVQLKAAYPLACDAHQLRQALAPPENVPREQADSAQLAAALEKYRGPLLDGFFIRDGRGFEEWLLLERENWRRLALHGFDRLARTYANHQEWTRAAAAARRLVELDPLREQSQQLQLRLLARQGKINIALQQYERFVDLLRETLDLPPEPETMRLAQRIRQAKTAPTYALPPELAPLFGREEELAAIHQRLDDHAARLITLVGIGGAGKTRLALAAAHQRRRDYLNGVCFIPLAGAEREAGFHSHLAEALAFNLEGQANPAAQLIDFLRDREMLLVLDNVEQIVEPVAGWIQQLLPQAPDIQLLLTSHERLQLREEWVLPLTGLPFGTAETEPGPALAFMRQRAAQFAPQSSTADGWAEAAREICTLVDGLPLALELASAAFAYHTPQEIAAELRENLDILRTQLRDLPPRHRSMRAVFAHSWGLLTTAEQRLFAGLSCFRDGFTAEAARAVTGAGRSVLESLQAKSLLHREPNGRFTLHDLLRQFAAAELSADPAWHRTVNAQHQTYFLDFLRRRQSPNGLVNHAALPHISRELENMLLVWQRMLTAADSDGVQQMLTGLAHYFYVRGLFHPALSALDEAAAAFEDGPAPLRAAVAAYRALFRCEIGAYDTAIAAAELALALNGDEATAVVPLACLCRGYARWSQGKFPPARADLQQAATQARTAGITWIEAQSLNTLGNVALDEGDLEQAQQLHRRALELADSADQRRFVASTLINLGNDCWHAGNFGEAHEHFTRALHICQETGIRQVESLAHLNIGLVMSELGDHPSGIDHIRRALGISREVGDRRGEGNALINLLVMLMEQGEIAAVADQIADALTLCRTVGDQQGEAIVLDLQAHLRLRTGDTAAAARILDAVWELCTRINDAWGLLETCISRAYLHLALHQPEAAIENGRQSVTRARDLTDLATEAKAHNVLGHAYLAQKSWVAALAAYETAITLWEQLKQPHLTRESAAGRLLALAWLERPFPPDAVDALVTILMEEPVSGLLEPVRAHYLCWQLLRLKGDARAAALRAHAADLLQQQAAQFTDPALAAGFLHDVPIHRDLIAGGEPVP